MTNMVYGFLDHELSSELVFERKDGMHEATSTLPARQQSSIAGIAVDRYENGQTIGI